MKYLIVLCLIIFTIAISCNLSKKKSALISQENLKTEKFTINTDRDTVLQTANKTLLKILAGALENKSGKSVSLEIKEAYSMQQIISAGLFTQSNGEPLSSGGMIYINASEGQEATFKQKIQVAIPTDYLQEGMELYKGEVNTDGNINWTNPDTLPENKQLASLENGKILFTKCESCHHIGKDGTGPNIAHFIKRFPATENNERYYFHRMQFRSSVENGAVAADTGSNHSLESEHYYAHELYKCNLQKMFGFVAPIFPKLDSDKSLLDLFNYIQNESDRQNLPYPSHNYLKNCVDSCEAYQKRTSSLIYLRTLSNQEREKLIAENGEMTNVIPDTMLPVNINPLTTADFKEKVSPRNFDATYYQFNVSSFGWYNIDMLLNNVEGVKESELFVRITGDYTKRVNLFLIIPSHKVYGEGGPADGDKEQYAFFKKDGKIPLPQNVKAYILAVSEQDDKIALGLKEFITSTKQEIEVSLNATTKEQFDLAVKDFDAQRLHINVAETINVDSIRKKDQEIKDIDQKLKDAENLKPKNCDCDCTTYPSATNSKVDTTNAK